MRLVPTRGRPFGGWGHPFVARWNSGGPTVVRVFEAALAVWVRVVGGRMGPMADAGADKPGGTDLGGSLPPMRVAAPVRPDGVLLILWRFLKMGCFAWGGPIAQIQMLRHEFVDLRGWVSPERFGRALAVYQALPGPEATELAVYLGMAQRGRLGGLAAGLGFLAPGLACMMALAWAYTHLGGLGPASLGALAGAQAAVTALVVIAAWRLGSQMLRTLWLIVIALLALLATSAGVHFALVLGATGLIYFLIRAHWTITAGLVTGLLLAGVGISATGVFGPGEAASAGGVAASVGAGGAGVAAGVAGGGGASASFSALSLAGLRAGLLTFGGAYTVLPFLQHDAVEVGRWLTQGQLLDGLALNSVIPAPMVTLGAFVGYLGGGPWGALVMMGCIYLPAFAFTLLGHRLIERALEHRALSVFLEGVTAGVIGLVGATALELCRGTLLVPGTLSLRAWPTVIFSLALVTLHLWRARVGTPSVVLIAALIGLAEGWARA
jgi:chromate transporter